MSARTGISPWTKGQSFPPGAKEHEDFIMAGTIIDSI